MEQLRARVVAYLRREGLPSRASQDLRSCAGLQRAGDIQKGGLGHLFLAFAIWIETLVLSRLGYVKRMLVEAAFDGLEGRTVSRWGMQSDT